MTDDRAPRTRTTLERPFATGMTVTLGALLAFGLGTAFMNLTTVLIWVAFALFAALGLDPVVRALEERGVARGWAIVVVFSLLTLVVVGVAILVLPTVIAQITQFVKAIPHLVDDFESSGFYAWLRNTFGADVGTLVSEIEGFLTHPDTIAQIGRGVVQAGGTIVATVSGLIVVLVLTLYFLASIPDMKLAFNRIFPARNRSGAAQMTDQITASVGGYLVGMVILAFCNAVVALILHLVLNLRFPLLMAAIAFCITLIPLVGSVLYWALATTLALFAGWLPALLFAAAYLVYMQLEAYVLTPRVMNRAISVPGALVVIGALVGGTLLGLLGAFIAIPVTASILLIGKQVFIPRQDART